jgi:hypothetical protein
LIKIFGLSDLPFGISFFGPAFSEPTLIKIACAFEQATKARKTPKFLPTYVWFQSELRAAPLLINYQFRIIN